MRVSLIIPCFNEEENLPILFNKLQNLKNNKSIEIVIVENGSTDNSLSVLKSFTMFFKKRFLGPSS